METYSVEFTYTYTGIMSVEAETAEIASFDAHTALNANGPVRCDINDEQFKIVSVEKSM